jgi:hypothetical protein
MLRCTEGDLAVVTHEEPGCEVNVGRMVTVCGPVKVHERFGPTWLIQPIHPGKWAVSRRAAGGVVFEYPPLRMVEHPDKWLMPLRPPEPNETAAVKVERPAPRTKVLEELL